MPSGLFWRSFCSGRGPTGWFVAPRRGVLISDNFLDIFRLKKPSQQANPYIRQLSTPQKKLQNMSAIPWGSKVVFLATSENASSCLYNWNLCFIQNNRELLVGRVYLGEKWPKIIGNQNPIDAALRIIQLDPWHYKTTVKKTQGAFKLGGRVWVRGVNVVPWRGALLSPNH